MQNPSKQNSDTSNNPIDDVKLASRTFVRPDER